MITIQQIIEYLTEHVFDPVPMFIMSAEINKTAPASSEYKRLYDSARKSKWYRELAGEQWDDGSWGRFHSMDSKSAIKQKYQTTESALRRAREIGLTKDDAMIAKCIAKMERYVRGEETWTDNIEQHKDKGKGHLFSRPFLTAGNINIFDPVNPAIKQLRETTVNTLIETFKSGSFDKYYWNQKVREYHITDAVAPGTYYGALLLQNSDCMNDTLQRQFLDCYWNKPDGIYYISSVPPSAKQNVEDKRFYQWLSTLELLSGFSLFHEYVRSDIIPHLLNETERVINADAKIGSAGIRYADSWRNKETRKADFVLRIARLLVKISTD